jgi:hypothetical protein
VLSVLYSVCIVCAVSGLYCLCCTHSVFSMLCPVSLHYPTVYFPSSLTHTAEFLRVLPSLGGDCDHCLWHSVVR